jgi:hypothetical protein
MRSKILTFGLTFFLGLGALAALGQSGLSEDNNFFHSEVVNATGASQYVSTTKMRQSVCDAWLFRNRSATQTIYINANSAVGFAGPAFVDDTNMIVVPPDESIELEDAVIKRFSVIASGAADLYWLCSCK